MQASDHEDETVSSCPRCERRSRRLRWVRRWLAACCLLVPLVAVAGIPVYVKPQVDPLQHADAVFVVGGYDIGTRIPFGIDLAEAGWAPNVVLSNPLNARWMYDWCHKPHPLLASWQCVMPTPPTTLGEGRELRRLAQENGWRKVIVVTHRSHISRARFVLERCFPGQLIMVEFPTSMSTVQWISEYVHQSIGYVKAFLFDRDC